MMEAFERDLNVLRFLLPSQSSTHSQSNAENTNSTTTSTANAGVQQRPVLLEVGPGSGILSCYLRLLLQASTPLALPRKRDARDSGCSNSHGASVCSDCGDLRVFAPLSLAADLNPTAAALSALTLARHCNSSSGANKATGPAKSTAVAAGDCGTAVDKKALNTECGPTDPVRPNFDVRRSDLLSSFPPPQADTCTDSSQSPDTCPQLQSQSPSATMPPVDVLLFNPPYVPSSAAETAHEDVYVRSYAGGARGRAVLDQLVPRLRPYLARLRATGGC